MKIAIDASKLEVNNKTGTEYYAQNLILGLLKSLPDTHQIILYSQKPLSKSILDLHCNVTNRIIKTKFLWTLLGLSLALLKDKPDIFYTPASIIPPIHPKKSIIVIHGLEYEAFPQAYSLFRFWHLAIFTKLSAIWASTIITPSQSTKDDLAGEYEINPNKIQVIQSGVPVLDLNKNEKIKSTITELYNEPYLLFIGRKELRKNLITIIEAFNLVKLSHQDLKLVLAGISGYGYQEIAKAIDKSEYKKDIINLNRVNNLEKLTLYKNSKAVLYPSYYEGFGFPILEALQQGIPVIASDIPSSREIGNSMIEYVEVEDIRAWAKAIIKIVDTDLTKENIKALKTYSQKFNFTDTIVCTKNIIVK
jgi:glycosyltransferase involved in cell wall biosynthesis